MHICILSKEKSLAQEASSAASGSTFCVWLLYDCCRGAAHLSIIACLVPLHRQLI
jgi:hypothetical protein